MHRERVVLPLCRNTAHCGSSELYIIHDYFSARKNTNKIRGRVEQFLCTSPPTEHRIWRTGYGYMRAFAQVHGTRYYYFIILSDGTNSREAANANIYAYLLAVYEHDV